MKPITEMETAQAAGIRYVLMDIDDTITTEGKVPAAAYGALWRLHDAGLAVIPVTGRPAGWCDLIVRQWPVDGVVGENGALVFWEEPAASAVTPPDAGRLSGNIGNVESEGNGRFPAGLRAGSGGRVLKQHFHPNAVRNDHPRLSRIKERALAGVPGLRLAKDQFARLFDIALDFAEEEPVLSLEEAQRVRDIALEEGAQAKVSSIHVNVWMGCYDKLSMAEWFLAECCGWKSGPDGDNEVIFIGDSPNDEPMFARFPLACAVANIGRYRGLIRHLPGFAASKESGEGFAEIVDTLLAKR